MRAPVILVLPLMLVAACGDRGDDAGDDVGMFNTLGNETDAPRQSIIREDVRNEMGAVVPVEQEGPRRLTVGFPDGGHELDDEALAALGDFVGEDVISGGEAIMLWGHSDSRGGEAPNRRASQARAEAVAGYLTDKGVDEERITIVALGADNPIAPNAKLDGSDDEEGQARNRRVEIMIGEMPDPDARDAAIDASRPAN